ncbi:MAG: NTP transferase domain-containing protein [Oscillospiraceae bacterium]|nr:NTP transferase domain-containing protein [Oscillospiraceae bacterium]
MNLQESDILRTLLYEPFINQRILAEISGHSLGVVNRSLRILIDEGYLTDQAQLTAKAKETVKSCAPRNAIILAAGFGMRMVPINLSTPKALLEVNGERLIDRIIEQLKAVGVNDITVVVGFMKDHFEYLIDEYGVELVVNPDYSSLNNLHSLSLVADRIHNTYIIPCDIWCDSNPFNSTELYSWYMVSDLIDEESTVRVNRKMELVTIPEKDAGNAMIGISYLLEPEAEIIREKLKKYDTDDKHTEAFWEETLYKKDRMILQARVVRSSDVVEINTYEQLRDLDSDSNHLKSDAIHTIATALGCREDDVKDISVLKKGMTNRSFLFSVNGTKYIMRIPGEGTDQLINRKNEAAVFKAISGLGLCDDPVYINPENGYKITKFLDGVRTADPADVGDLKLCMDKLCNFHQLHLTVPHTFDVFGQIEFYESLWDGSPSIYRDYAKTKENVLSLKSFIDGIDKEWCLTHIDAVCDNFLFYQTGHGEALQLTDWEYSGMQDPHVDIAMFCIYSLYNKRQTDRLIDIYFNSSCDQPTRTKIYCYIAACGLLWSNWCEYKRKLGVEFGEYSLRQYRYAKDYYRYAKELMEQSEEE